LSVTEFYLVFVLWVGYLASRT